MSSGSDEPTHGEEYPPLEKSSPQPDPYAPVDYPTDSVNQPPPYQAPPSGYQQPGYPPPDYPQSGYPPPDYPQSGYPPPGYPPPGAPPTGYPPPYQGGYGYSYDPYAQARPTGTNGKAIAALVTSLASFACCFVPGFVGIILGVMAMREIKRTGQEGHGLALAGAIVGAIVLALQLLGVVFVVFFGALDATSSYSNY